MTRAFTDLDKEAREMAQHLALIRNALDAEDGTELDDAISVLETFVALSLRVLRKTNPSKIRSEARTVEIAARIAGVPVARGAA